MFVRPNRSVGKGYVVANYWYTSTNSELIGIIIQDLEDLVSLLCTIDLFYSWIISGYFFEGKYRYA